MTGIDIRNITQATTTRKSEMVVAGHFTSNPVSAIKHDNVQIRSDYIDLTAGAMFLTTPDGILHRRDMDGHYTPAITLKSYNMAASLQSSNDN